MGPDTDRRDSPVLRVAISTRALFQLEEEHAVFESKGDEAYTALQRAREGDPLEKGAGYEVVRRLLALNAGARSPLVEVVLLSRTPPDLSLRAIAAIRQSGLILENCSFTSGRPVAPFVAAWGVDLFLSNDGKDVASALDFGVAAGRLGPVPPEQIEDQSGEVRIALDGDAVLFDPESDKIFRNQGLEAFIGHETRYAMDPMRAGPFFGLLKKLTALRGACVATNGQSRIRIAVVTSRSTSAHARVIRTLRAWQTPVDEAHFVGAADKAPVLSAFGAHIFFDDQERYVTSAARVVSAAHVPSDPMVTWNDPSLHRKHLGKT